ncbi:MAG: hypothetical protein HN576_11050 [Bacteriovoracaceae bacterium]|jgi:UDP-2,3-diacylglucosamine pyrophosphatase LpxH|nr:hypothetical protein [Bacteriovoracaceae bacterium]
MLLLVLSDLHLGKGKFLKNGQLNILEDFLEDERFKEFCEYFSSGRYYLADVHLVLNGDILNLIQIDLEGVFHHIIDDEHTTKVIELIHKGHKQFFQALKKFLSVPNKKITYIIGNHDAGMAFPLAQKAMRKYIGEEIRFSFDVNIDGVHIEHGHRFEVINTVPEKKYFRDGPKGKPILNLPWGSLFCIEVLPIIKKLRPYIDKVRPMNSYIKWLLLHDFFFFIKMTWNILRYFFQTRTEDYLKLNSNFKTSIKVLKQITIYPIYENKAKSILKQKPHLHTVVMGHTHVQEWRRFPEGKYYFNTGTWNPIPSMDAGLHESATKLCYCMIDVHSKSQTVRSASLNMWQGSWRPFISDISL